MKEILAALLLGVLVCAGCNLHNSGRDAGDEPAGASDSATAAASEKKDPLQLDPQEIANAGIRTIPAASTNRAIQVTGYGVVLSHDTIAQSLAELRQAEAVAAQSRSALTRAEHLKGTPGAMSADQVETALRQSVVDASGAALARQKLSALIGRPTPEGRSLESLLQSVADGERKILRATFALSEPPIARGTKVRAIRLGIRDAQAIESLGPAWPAPADPGIPGRSYFAVVASDALAEGERVTATASSDESLGGVFVPRAAVVLFDAKPWFYIEHAVGAFRRIALEPERHVEGGYALTQTLGSSDQIVVEGAGILLAKEQGADEPD